LVGSQLRGVPGLASNGVVKHYPIPGLSTWLSGKLLLATNNENISNLLIKACKMMSPKDNVNVTVQINEVRLSLQKALILSVATADRDFINHFVSTDDHSNYVPSSFEEVKDFNGPFVDLPHTGELDMTAQKEQQFLAYKKEMAGITLFCNKVSPQTFFLFEHRYMWEIISFVSSELFVLVDVIHDFHSRFTFKQQSKLFYNTCKIHRDNFVKVIKWHTACPMAYLLKETLPPRPKGHEGHFLLWTGPVKRFLKNLLNTRNFKSPTGSKSLRLSFAFLQGIKRGCATVPDSFLRLEVLKHVLAMSTPPLVKPFLVYQDLYGRDIEVDRYSDVLPPLIGSSRLSNPIADAFKACANAFLRNNKKEYEVKVYEPSHNSCFEASRQDGGAYMEIVDQLKLELTESDDIIIKGKIVKNTSYSLPDMHDVLDRCRSRVAEKMELTSVLDQFEELKEFIPRFDELKEDNRNVINTSVIPLTEPLKVRVITKSEALFSYAAKSLQKSLKHYINRFPSLVLTTRPLEPSDFRKVWEFERKLESDLGFSLDFTDHLSGDYSAATDGLNVNLTKLIFERSLYALNVPEGDRDIYRNVLYEQRLRYPKTYTNFLRDPANGVSHLDVTPKAPNFSILQQNGQLMGSILSFPVLCLANLICYKAALEEYINTLRDKKLPPYRVSVFMLPCLVNGDDIYFRTNSAFTAIWLKYITIAGFQLSIGKNYIHPSVFTINSQCFHYNLETDTLLEYTYLNVGLLKGQSKSGVIGEKLPLGDLYNKVLKGSYNPVVTHNRFLNFHKNSLIQMSGQKKYGHSYKGGNYNFFLPKLLGGLGFILPSKDIPLRLTMFQRQLATFLHNKIVQMSDKPVLGFRSYAPYLVDENAPVIHEPYLGEYQYTSFKKTGEPPVGFTPLRLIKSETHLMFHQLPNMTPKLEFRSFNYEVLREFRADPNRYHGVIDWFGLEASVTGNYPYELARSKDPDPVTFMENEANVLVPEILTSIINGIF